MFVWTSVDDFMAVSSISISVINNRSIDIEHRSNKFLSSDLDVLHTGMTSVK